MHGTRYTDTRIHDSITEHTIQDKYELRVTNNQYTRNRDTGRSILPSRDKDRDLQVQVIAITRKNRDTNIPIYRNGFALLRVRVRENGRTERGGKIYHVAGSRSRR